MSIDPLAVGARRAEVFASTIWPKLGWFAKARLLWDQDKAWRAFCQACNRWEVSDGYEYVGESLKRSKEKPIESRWLARTKYYSGFGVVTLWLVGLVIQILVRYWLDRGDEAMKELRG